MESDGDIMKRMLYTILLILFSALALTGCGEQEMEIGLSKGRSVNHVSFTLNNEEISISNYEDSYSVLKRLMKKLCNSEEYALFILNQGAYSSQTLMLRSISETNRYEDGELIKKYQYQTEQKETIHNYRDAFDNKFFVMSSKTNEKLENKKKTKEEGHFNYFRDDENLSPEDKDYSSDGGNNQKRYTYYFDYENTSGLDGKDKDKMVYISRPDNPEVFSAPIPSSVLRRYFPVGIQLGFTINDSYIQAYPEFFDFQHELTDKYIILTYEEKYRSQGGIISPENYNSLYKEYIGSFTKYIIYLDYRNIVTDETGDHLYCSALDYHSYILTNATATYTEPQAVAGLQNTLKEVEEERKITTLLDISKSEIEKIKNSFIHTF